MWFEDQQDGQDGCHGGHLWYQKGTILAILHAAPMPSTKFLLYPTYGSGADNNWRLPRWSPWQPSWIPFWCRCQKCEKMWHYWHRDEAWTMVNRPQHKLAWSKAPGELTFEDLQDGYCGGHRGYHNKMVLPILNLHAAPMPPTKCWAQCLPLSFGSIWLTIWEQMRFEGLQDGYLGAHLINQNRMILAILNLYVTLMPPTKFGLYPH